MGREWKREEVRNNDAQVGFAFGMLMRVRRWWKRWVSLEQEQVALPDLRAFGGGVRGLE